MKANYSVRLYSEFTKRSRTIKLYQMDFGQLAEWILNNMKTYYIFLFCVYLLLSSCSSVTNNSVLEYEVIEIENCEYILVKSKTYGIGLSVTSITHKGNCKYCSERNNMKR